MKAERSAHYAVVNGLEIYYEMHGPAGKGPPLVLLHGGVGGIEMFGPNLPALAQSHRIIAVDLQGHGRTADVDRPLRYESMADDIAALIKQLGAAPADVMGYSLGGGVALQTAIRHHDLVNKLIVVSCPFKRDGFYPEILAIFDQMGPAAAAGMKQSPLYKLYPKVDWERLFTELYKLLGGGQRDAGLDGSLRSPNRLAIVPGTTHYDILATTTVAGMVDQFLGAAK